MIEGAVLKRVIRLSRWRGQPYARYAGLPNWSHLGVTPGLTSRSAGWLPIERPLDYPLGDAARSFSGDNAY